MHLYSRSGFVHIRPHHTLFAFTILLSFEPYLQEFLQMMFAGYAKDLTSVASTYLAELHDIIMGREHAYNFLFERQRPDGSFPFSVHDAPYLRNQASYGFLTDSRSYPRQLSYILQHLLIKAQLESNLACMHDCT